MTRILLLEDEVELGELMAQLMERHGNDVVLCHDMRTAVERIRDTEFDLVVTDLFMQERGVLLSNGGLQLIGIIRNSRRDPLGGTANDVPILAISGLTGGQVDQHFLDAARRIGADSALPKPVPSEVLQAEIERLIYMPRNGLQPGHLADIARRSMAMRRLGPSASGMNEPGRDFTRF